jgi:hypothetical protein
MIWMLPLLLGIIAGMVGAAHGVRSNQGRPKQLPSATVVCPHCRRRGCWAYRRM